MNTQAQETPKPVTMTYGVLPSREDFDAAFEAKCEDGTFSFRNDRFAGEDSLSCDQLWSRLVEAKQDHDFGGDAGEAAGSWASDVLSVLGFEWI